MHECLNGDGSPDLASAKRVRAQARQIYCYAHATCLGWFDGIGFAGNTLDWLLAKARITGSAPGFAHLLKPDGSITAMPASTLYQVVAAAVEADAVLIEQAAAV